MNTTKVTRDFARLLVCTSLAVLSVSPMSALATGPAPATIDWSIEHQTMNGFGASDAFLDQPLTDAQADFYFTTNGNGIGLTWLRMGIDPSGGLISDPSTWSDATKAVARGAKVWAAPWSAPAEWKDNDNVNNGGSLCAAAGQGSCTASHYDDWATRLATFAGLLKQNAGVDLWGLSIQNEPDYTASYQSMLVSNDQFVNFINVLGPKLAALNPKPVIIAGEYSNWQYLTGMATTIDANTSAHNYTAIYASHQYVPQNVVNESLTRPVWQTEMSSFEAFDPSIYNGVTVAKWIHSAVVTGNVSVWHYWWLYNPYNEDNEGLIGYPEDRNATTKRAYTLGNFSKFVRPGWTRIDVSNVSSANLFVSAFKGPHGDFAIVVINDSIGNISFDAQLAQVNVATVTPWVTTASANLAQQAPIALTNNELSTTVPVGVTTFVGIADEIFKGNFELPAK